jgi:hypothetical protein
MKLLFQLLAIVFYHIGDLSYRINLNLFFYIYQFSMKASLFFDDKLEERDRLWKKVENKIDKPNKL